MRRPPFPLAAWLLGLALAVGCAADEPVNDLPRRSAGDWTTETVPADTFVDPGGGADPDLELELGCPGVFNPDQVLTLHLTLEPADWQALLADSTYQLYVPGQFQCEGEAPIPVAYRRKRSGGNEKIGLKIDFNHPELAVDGGRWQGLRKLSLENGVSEGQTEDGIEVKAYVAEYLGWRIFNQGDLATGRASFVDVQLNGSPLGVFVNVEQVDAEFLQDRFEDDTGWLYKKSGGVNDGYKTLEGIDNPHDDWFCFWGGGGGGCEPPSQDVLLAELPQRLDVAQMLWFGAINAYIANTDAPLFKDNNYYYYDSDLAPRRYIPWDLDTTMRDLMDVRTGSANGPDNGYDGVMLSLYMAEYEGILAEVLQRAPASFVAAELDRVLTVAGPHLDADPYVSGDTQGAVDALNDWWITREADVAAQLGL